MELQTTELEYMKSIDASEWCVIYNGGDTLGIKFFVGEEQLVVYLPKDKAGSMAQMLLGALERGRIA